MIKLLIGGLFFSLPLFHLHSLRPLSSAVTVKVLYSLSHLLCLFFSPCIHFIPFFLFPSQIFKLYAYSNLYTSILRDYPSLFTVASPVKFPFFFFVVDAFVFFSCFFPFHVADLVVVIVVYRVFFKKNVLGKFLMNNLFVNSFLFFFIVK